MGFFLVLSLGFLEKFSFFHLISNNKTQSIKIIINYLLISILFLLIGIFNNSNETLNFSFLKEKMFWMTMFFENLILVITLRNYNKQNNFSQIAFATFSSVYLISLVSLFYNFFFNLSTKINSPYASNFEMILFSFIFFLLIIFYFFDKLKKNLIKHPFELFLFSILITNNLYFALYTIQHYNIFLAYPFIFISMSIVQFYFLKKIN